MGKTQTFAFGHIPVVRLARSSWDDEDGQPLFAGARNSYNFYRPLRWDALHCASTSDYVYFNGTVHTYAVLRE